VQRESVGEIPSVSEGSFIESFVEKRLAIALVAYVALAILTWTTIDDQRIRLVTIAILAMFAVKTWVRRKDVMRAGHGSERE